jgi:hypothetical protein
VPGLPGTAGWYGRLCRAMVKVTEAWEEARMLEALLTLAGNTLVAAASTDAWDMARRRFARVLGRGDPKEEQLAERRLEETRHQLEGVNGEELEKAQANLAQVWRIRLADLLEEDPGVEAELCAVVEQIRAQLLAAIAAVSDHAVASGGDATVSASEGAAGVIHGGVAPLGPTRPGPASGQPGPCSRSFGRARRPPCMAAKR